MRTARSHDAKHLQFIRTLACIKCGDNTATEAAHIRMADARIAKPITGIGIKPDDRFVLPLCSKCHRLQHAGSEAGYWAGGDPVLWALALYSVSGDAEAGERIIKAAELTQWDRGKCFSWASRPEASLASSSE